jgi:hypothetical protein
MLPQLNDMVSVGDLTKLNQALRKAAVDYQTSTVPSAVAGASLSPLVPQSIEGTLTSATYTMKELALWPAIPKTSVTNTVHEYNVIKSHGLDLDPFISEGGGGVLNLSSYSREFVKVKFMAERRSVTDVATLVNILGSNPSAIAEETERGTLSLMQKVEHQLWHGNASLTDDLGFDGIFKQLEDAGGDNITDLGGAELTPDKLQDILAETTAAPNFGRPDCIYVEPRVYSSLIQQTVNYGRHDQMTAANGTLTFGVSKLAINSPMGPVPVKSAPFLFTANKAPASDSGHSVAAAVISSGPAMAGTGGFASADLGTYYYKIVPVVKEKGYGAPVPSTAAAVATAGHKVTITMSDVAEHSYYRVYRSEKNAANANDATWIMDVKKTASGTTAIVDDNSSRTKTSKVFIAQHDPGVFQFVRMLDFLRRPLAEVDTQRPFLLMLFGSPIVKVPSKLAMLKNVGS